MDLLLKYWLVFQKKWHRSLMFWTGWSLKKRSPIKFLVAYRLLKCRKTERISQQKMREVSEKHSWGLINFSPSFYGRVILSLRCVLFIASIQAQPSAVSDLSLNFGVPFTFRELNRDSTPASPHWDSAFFLGQPLSFQREELVAWAACVYRIFKGRLSRARFVTRQLLRSALPLSLILACKLNGACNVRRVNAHVSDAVNNLYKLSPIWIRPSPILVSTCIFTE